MGWFDILRGPGMDQGVQECRETPGGVLLDVRTPEEYRAGHVPGSRNVPLDQLSRIGEAAPGKDAPLFVYCHSGARSRQAVGVLRRMGYENVRNIGGIANYRGEVEYR